MINGAAKLLTLLSVLIHAGFGCCAHHDHGTQQPSEPVAVKATASQTTPHCCCRHHAHDGFQATNTAEGGTDSRPDHGSCPGDECPEGCPDHCSWLTNSRVELSDDHDMTLPTAMAAACLWHAADSSLMARRGGGPPLLSELTDSLRAKTQVWQL